MKQLNLATNRGKNASASHLLHLIYHHHCHSSLHADQQSWNGISIISEEGEGEDKWKVGSAERRKAHSWAVVDHQASVASCWQITQLSTPWACSWPGQWHVLLTNTVSNTPAQSTLFTCSDETYAKSMCTGVHILTIISGYLCVSLVNILCSINCKKLAMLPTWSFDTDSL